VRPPQWAIDLVERAISAMDLGRWDVDVSWGTEEARKGTNGIQPEYECAVLAFHVENEDDRRGQLAVVHEVAHLSHVPLYTAFEYVLQLVPLAHRELARGILENADELVVQREAVAWTRQLSGGCTSAACRCIIGGEADAGQEPPAQEE
jgi:hypothetical protein